MRAFYEFMSDHADEAVAATGDPRWGELTVSVRMESSREGHR